MHEHRGSWIRRLTWLLAAAWLALPAQALAARVALVGVEGPATAAKRARASLLNGLSMTEGLEVVSEEELAAAMKASKVKPAQRLTAAGIKKTAAAGALDGLLAGQVQQRGAKRFLRLRYFDASGRARLDTTYRLAKNDAVPPAALDAVALLATNGNRSKEAPPAVEPPASTETAEAAPSPVVQAAPAARFPDGSDGEQSQPTDTLLGQSRKAPFISVELLLGGLQREYALEGPASQVSYVMDGASFASGLSVELAPLAPLAPELTGVRLGAELLRGFLSSRLRDANGQEQSLASPTWHWSIDAGYRHRLLKQSLWGPTLGADLGFSQWSFGGEQLPALACTRHASLLLELSASQPVVPHFASLELAVSLSPFGWLGEEQLEAYADVGSTFGWQLRAGVAGKMRRDGRGPRFGARFEISQFSDSLGKADDPAEASETWTGFGGWVGYAY